MVKIFGTDIIDPQQAKYIIKNIRNVYPNYTVNFDLEDCDHILRIEAQDLIAAADIIKQVVSCGYKCIELE